MAAKLNSFIRFLFGFSIFIVISLGLAFVVGTYSIQRDREEQTAAALKAMLNEPEEAWWRAMWR